MTPAPVPPPPARRIAELSRGQLDLLVQRLRTKAHPPPGLRRRQSGSASFPLSFAQERLWFLAQLHPRSPAYNVASVLEAGGELLWPAMARALAAVVERHEVLRAAIVSRDGVPFHRIAPSAALRMPAIDLCRLPRAGRTAELRRLCRQEARRPFDLAAPPLLRATLLRLGRQEHALILVTHHLVSDGWSANVMAGEVATCYRAFAAGEPAPLAELAVQFGDFVAWQREALQGDGLRSDLEYWTRQLAGLEPCTLPADRPRPPVQSFRGAWQEVALPAPLAVALRRFSALQGVTPFATVLAAFAALLERYSTHPDVAIGSPVAGRNRSDLEPLIGFFANTLVMRMDLAGDPDFSSLVERAWGVARDAYGHQDLPFEQLVEKLAPARSLSQDPFFQVLLAYQQAPPELHLPHLELALRSLDTGSAKFDLTLSLAESESGLRGWLEYSTDLFDAATVARLGGHLRRLLAAAVAQPRLRLSQLPWLSVAERHQLLVEHNAAAAPPAAGWADAGAAGVYALFAAQAVRTPEAVALVAGGRRWRYAELRRRAARVAGRLAALGVAAEERVGVLAERSAEAVAAMLGTLAVGAAYLPLEPRYPDERIRFMVADAGARVVLTQEKLAGRLAGLAVAAVCLDGGWLEAPSDEPAEAWAAVSPRALAYLIYTSGSTGAPKGVALEQGGVVGLLRWARQAFSDAELAGVLAATSFCFDLSVFELFAPLAWGGTVLLAESVLELPVLASRDEVRLVNTVPSAMAELVAAAGLPPAVRTVSLAGEPLPRALAERLYAESGVERVLNLYGPSEDTTYSTWAALRPGEAGPVELGTPLPDTRLYLLDRAGEPVPLGVPAELCLASASLARGYWRRPELTAERFVPDPFAAHAGGRLYRTGDLVRRRAGGALEFLGRIDQQVKVRGFRIEPGEIEAVLSSHPAVAESAVVVAGEGTEQRRLVGYVVLRAVAADAPDAPEATDAVDAAAAAPAELRAYLAGRLPQHLVPATLVTLDRLPRTPNGKLDRRELARRPAAARPGRREAAGGRGTVPPTPGEELLAGLWAELLALPASPPAIGVGDSFFDLGGHSLLATRLVSRIRGVFGVELPLTAVFETPTLAGLAARIGAAAGDATPRPAAPAVTRRPAGETAPLSFGQERLWFLDRLAPGSPAYHMPAALRLRGRFDAPAFRLALDEIRRRHEALRTVFAMRSGSPVAVVQPPSALPAPALDLSTLPAGRREAEARRRLAAEVARPFDLERGPLVRSLLLVLGAADRIVAITLHHAVGDGWSAGLLRRELAALYAAFAWRRPSPLPELAIQYGDYATWQRRWLTPATLQVPLSYWRTLLAGAPDRLDLPTDRPRPAVLGDAGGRLAIALDEGSLAGAGAAGRQWGATRFMVFAAAWGALLSRHAGQSVVLLGFPIAHRTRVELEALIGLFANTLVLRCDLAGDPSFGALLERVREATLGAYQHQELPFERLVEELAPARSLSRAPLFQAMVAFQQDPDAAPALPGLAAELVEVDTGSAKFDLTLSLAESESGLRGWLEYSTDLFDAATVARLGGHLRRLLAAAVAQPRLRLSQLPWLSVAELHQLLVEHNAAAAPPAAGWADAGAAGVYALFAAQAARTPEAVALVAGGRRWRYAELRRRAARVAGRLAALGVAAEERVGVLAERSAEAVAAMLGTLAVGAAYLPLEPRYPDERIRFMVADAGARVVLTQEKLAGRLAGLAVAAVCLDGGWLEAPGDEPAEAWAAVSPRALAYLIYTSGSTGAPKGVALEQGGVVGLLRWARQAFSDAELAGVLAATSFCFDLSVFELFAPLAWGGTVLLAESVLELPVLASRDEVRLVNTVPSAMAELVAAAGLPPAVRTVSLAGEPLPRALAERLYAESGVERVLNLYGPSEDTTYSTWAALRPGEAGPVELGTPLPDTRLYLLDRAGEPVPLGVPAELCLAGASLARGYWRRPELTAERFVPDPFAAHAGGRLYRTGDLVRRRAGGALEFLGRIDQQVKVRGFRIEPGEIEAVLSSHPAVAESAVVVAGEGTEQRRLVGYVVLRAVAAEAPDAPEATDAVDAAAAAPAELRAYLAGRLPQHLVPATLVTLDRLPRTPNGKLDRRELARRPAAPPAREGAAPAPPRTPFEEILAAIWGEVLGVERMGVEDDFFALGGHSLLAARVISRLRGATGVELSLRDLFEAPTVARLAALAEARAGKRLQAPAEPIPRLPAGADIPLSFAQQRLWLLHQLHPRSAAYNLCGLVRLAGPLQVPVLARALAAIARRHEALRTVFPVRGGEPRQRIMAPAPVRLARVSLAGLPRGRREQEARARARADAWRPFDLAAGPLLRVSLFELDDEDRIALIALHHIVFDGWSLGLLLQETAVLYAAFAAGSEPDLPELPIQYADFAHWQRQRLGGPLLAAHLAYWREQLAGAPERIDLPADRPRPPAGSARSTRHEALIPAELAAGLAAFGRRHGVTVFMVLLAALDAVLYRWTGQGDLVVGTVVAGRDRLDVEKLIGCFVNFIPLRLRLQPDDTALDLLRRVRATVLEGFFHQECPFEEIVGAVAAERRPDGNPLYNVALLLQSFPQDWDFGERLAARLVAEDEGLALVDLRLVAEERPGGLSLVIEYAAEHFTAATIQQLAAAYGAALEWLIREPDGRLASFAPAALAIHAGGGAPPEPERTIAIAATFTAEPVAAALDYWLQQLDLPARVRFAPYGQVFQQLLDPASLLSTNRSGLNVVLVRLEDWLHAAATGAAAASPERRLDRNVEDLVSALAAAAHRAAAPWVVCVCPPSPAAVAEPGRAARLRAGEERLCRELAGVRGIHPLGSAELLELYPVADCHDPHAERLGHVPYAPAFFTALGTLLARRFHALASPPYKVIALDCDQTLWRGVCGEDGAQGIELDAGHRALQELMLAQHAAGMLLCLCSKNQEEDVAAVFEQGPPMPLRREHFAAARVNWLPKSENLRSLAAELGLGLDSFVLLDDDPVECAEVESRCPEVLVLALPREPAAIPRFLRHVWAFDRLAVTAEDSRRNALYRQQRDRESFSAAAPSLEEFLAGLDLRIRIAAAAPHQLARAAQLTQRTNQFNATTRRRDESQIAALCGAGELECQLVEAGDRFGDYGLVGVMLFALRPDALVVDTFLLSCRALGRGVEHAMLARLGEIALARLGDVELRIPCLPTPRNQPARDFLQTVLPPPARQADGLLFRIPAAAAARVSRLSLVGA